MSLKLSGGLFSTIFVLISSHLFIHIIHLFTTVDANIDMTQYDCVPESPNSDHEQYKTPILFASKTRYLVSRTQNRLRYFDTANWYDALISKNAKTCKPIYHYFLSRHTIRYPNKNEINRYVNEVPPIARDLLRTGRLPLEEQDDFSRWRPMFSEIDEFHVTPSGEVEIGITAEIFYSYFPSLYDIDNLNITVSHKIRTRETALAFVSTLVDLQLQQKQRRSNGSSPIKYTEEWNAAAKAELKRIDQSITQSDLLMIHTRCKMWMKAQGIDPKKPKLLNELLASAAYRRMADQFNERNGLRDASRVDPAKMLTLSELCAYETAFYGYSPWCRIFLISERAALNYLVDIKGHFGAYGFYPNRKMGCLLIVDLHRKLSAVMSNPNVRHQTTLYFAHDNLLSRLYSFLRLFELFPEVEYIGKQFPRVCIPRYREWITELVLPFGANFAVTILNCDPRSPRNLKMLTLINEVPVGIPGCPKGYCNLITFLEYYKDLENNCNADEICPLTEE